MSSMNAVDVFMLNEPVPPWSDHSAARALCFVKKLASTHWLLCCSMSYNDSNKSMVALASALGQLTLSEARQFCDAPVIWVLLTAVC